MEENLSIKSKSSRAEGVQEVVWSKALSTPKPHNWLSNNNDETFLAMQCCPLKPDMLAYQTDYNELL